MVPQENNAKGSLQEQYGLVDEQKSKQSVKYSIMSFGYIVWLLVRPIKS